MFIENISLSDGTIESVLLLESAVRVEFRMWDGGKAIFRFKGVIGVRDRNAVGQEIESMETEGVPPIRRVQADPFVDELLAERPEGRVEGVTRYAFIGSWTMRPILEVYAEEVEAQREYAF